MLCKALVDLHRKYRADQYFDWLMDDCLASFGRRIPKENLPPEDARDDIFKLAKQVSRVYQIAPPFADVLGQIYQYLSSVGSKQWMGQYFTPSSVATLMAQMNLSITQLETYAVREKVMRIGDIAGCGSGALLLAVAQEIYCEEPALLGYVSFTGVDLDHTCCRMASLNFLAHCYFIRTSVGEILIMQGNGLEEPQQWKRIIHATRADLPAEAFESDLPEPMSEAAEHYGIQATEPDKTEEQLNLF